MSEPLYVCVYLPEFPAQALLRLRPELALSPVVVVAGDPPLEEVCSANAHAFRLGVTQGMTRAELDSFPNLSILRKSEPEERNARAALLEAAGVFTPRIEVQALSSAVFAMVLDMTGTTRMFGEPAQAVRGIAAALSRLSFFVQLAASANLHAAVCIALAARKTPLILPPGSERQHLHNLPLSALNLTPQQAETLSLWGLRCVGELAALPEVELVVRLGQAGKRLGLLARGEHPHHMVPEEAVFALEEFLAFDAPLEILDSLLFVVGPMLDQLLARAQNRALALASVTLKLALDITPGPDGPLGPDAGSVHERTIKPALPVAQREVLLKLLHLDLQAHPPPAGVLSVLVHAEPGDRSKVQLGLFAPQLPEPMRLDVTLARIAALVGEDRVGRATLLDAHRPDSFRMERFVVPTSSPEKKVRANPTFALRRCRPPQPLSVQQEQQRPFAFSLRGKRYHVQEAYGPWRKSGDWWSAGVWSREEWDVRATAATAGAAATTLLCIITYDLLRHIWHLEALYD